MSPLADYIESLGLSNGRLAARAAKHGIEVSSETIRQARKDLYKGPLKPGAVKQLAAALEIPEREVRRLDNLRWSTTNATGGEITEADVMAWLRAHLAEDLAAHIISQYEKLKELTDARDGPHPQPGRGVGASPSTR